MASIVRQKVGKNVYVYESVSFRTKDGKPRNKRTIIGKIDKPSGSVIYKSEYIEKMKRLGKPVLESKVKETYARNEVYSSIIKEYGASYFYNKICADIGLTEILQKVYPAIWKELYTLACYLVSTGDPMMYCQDWIEKTESLPVKLTSPEISMLLQELTHEKQEEFYRCWCDYRSEKEYLALDITSISSYSQNIGTVEWGYNRDHEKLPQLNLCMIVGETSRLPIFQMLYNGSIKDVSTLKTSLRTAFSIGRKKLTLVLDKGFYSKENVGFMLKGGGKESFLIAVPHTTKLSRGLITETKWMADNPGRAIKINDKESIQGMTKQIDWDNGQKLFAHVYYNMLKAADAKYRLYSYVASLVEEAQRNPRNKQYEQ